MFAVSASADGSTYYPLMFVRDAAIGEQDDGKRFYFPTVPIDVYELEIFSARDGGDVVEFAEFQLVNAQGERIGDGAVGFGDDTDSDTSANAESLAYMEPTYVYPWQGADGDPNTVVRGSLSGAGVGDPPRALSVAVERHAAQLEPGTEDRVLVSVERDPVVLRRPRTRRVHARQQRDEQEDATSDAARSHGGCLAGV